MTYNIERSLINVSLGLPLARSQLETDVDRLIHNRISKNVFSRYEIQFGTTPKCIANKLHFTAVVSSDVESLCVKLFSLLERKELWSSTIKHSVGEIDSAEISAGGTVVVHHSKGSFNSYEIFEQGFRNQCIKSSFPLQMCLSNSNFVAFTGGNTFISVDKSGAASVVNTNEAEPDTRRISSLVSNEFYYASIVQSDRTNSFFVFDMVNKSAQKFKLKESYLSVTLFRDVAAFVRRASCDSWSVTEMCLRTGDVLKTHVFSGGGVLCRAFLSDYFIHYKVLHCEAENISRIGVIERNTSRTIKCFEFSNWFFDCGFIKGPYLNICNPSADPLSGDAFPPMLHTFDLSRFNEMSSANAPVLPIHINHDHTKWPTYHAGRFWVLDSNQSAVIYDFIDLTAQESITL